MAVRFFMAGGRERNQDNPILPITEVPRFFEAPSCSISQMFLREAPEDGHRGGFGAAGEGDEGEAGAGGERRGDGEFGELAGGDAGAGGGDDADEDGVGGAHGVDEAGDVVAAHADGGLRVGVGAVEVDQDARGFGAEGVEASG